MANYIKWELKDYFYKKYKLFIGIGIIFLLTAIIPDNSESFFAGLIYLAFFLIMIVSLSFSFIIGTKRITDSFKKKTFLLESMIPLPVKKILLSKFIIGFIINFIYSFIGIIGLGIILSKGANINLFDVFNEILENMNALDFIRFCICYILSILTFMATISFGFILSKVLRPNGKGNNLLSIIIWFILLYTIGYIISSIGYDYNEGDIVLDIVYTITTLLSYYVSSWLIENKLEIYK